MPVVTNDENIVINLRVINLYGQYIHCTSKHNKIPLCIQLDSTTNKEGRCLLLQTGHHRDFPYNRVTYTVRQIVQRFARWKRPFRSSW